MKIPEEKGRQRGREAQVGMMRLRDRADEENKELEKAGEVGQGEKAEDKKTDGKVSEEVKG